MSKLFLTASKQDRNPEMGAGSDKVDVGFGCDFVSGAQRRIKILLLRVTDTYPSPSKDSKCNTWFDGRPRAIVIWRFGSKHNESAADPLARVVALGHLGRQAEASAAVAELLQYELVFLPLLS